MRIYLQALDLRKAIEDEYEIAPLPDNPAVSQIKTHKEKKTRKSKEVAGLFTTVSSNILTCIMCLQSVKEEKVYSKKTIVASEEKLNDISGLPSDDLEEDDYNTENLGVEKNNLESEASSDESIFFSASEDLVEAPPKDDGILGLFSEDSENDDFNPDDLDKVVCYLEEEAIHSYTLYLNDIDLGEIENIPAPAIATDHWRLPKDMILKDVVTVIRVDEAHHRDVNHFASPWETYQADLLIDLSKHHVPKTFFDKNGKRPLEDDQEVENVQCRLPKQSDGSNLVEVDLSLGGSSAFPDEHADSKDHDKQADNQNHAGDNSDRSTLFPAINRDSSITFLIHCSRSHYGAISSLNRNFC
ncbi:Ubiquinol oxidase 2, mitochondrial [Capsicum baccatum]|uniref:Ubiquinol oxidase n=1 Tax=Capsicum baccatum TaxID=33114 RepID=A0A2G2VLM4_CAPBA|nr:Ubiquinol oxidase 2, mitochondrial [Capsicum baccatum]